MSTLDSDARNGYSNGQQLKYHPTITAEIGMEVMPEKAIQQAVDALLTAPALAAYLSVPLGTVYAWNYRGVGPSSCHVGRYVRYRRSDVENWLEAHAGSAK